MIGLEQEIASQNKMAIDARQAIENQHNTEKLLQLRNISEMTNNLKQRARDAYLSGLVSAGNVYSSGKTNMAQLSQYLKTPEGMALAGLGGTGLGLGIAYSGRDKRSSIDDIIYDVYLEKNAGIFDYIKSDAIDKLLNLKEDVARAGHFAKEIGKGFLADLGKQKPVTLSTGDVVTPMNLWERTGQNIKSTVEDIADTAKMIKEDPVGYFSDVKQNVLDDISNLKEDIHRGAETTKDFGLSMAEQVKEDIKQKTKDKINETIGDTTSSLVKPLLIGGGILGAGLIGKAVLKNRFNKRKMRNQARIYGEGVLNAIRKRAPLDPLISELSGLRSAIEKINPTVNVQSGITGENLISHADLINSGLAGHLGSHADIIRSSIGQQAHNMSSSVGELANKVLTGNKALLHSGLGTMAKGTMALGAGIAAPIIISNLLSNRRNRDGG